MTAKDTTEFLSSGPSLEEDSGIHYSHTQITFKIHGNFIILQFYPAPNNNLKYFSCVLTFFDTSPE